MNSPLNLAYCCSRFSELTPGKTVLTGVPSLNNAIGIGAPLDHPRTSMDVLIEHDLIEIRRSDWQPFNVRHYREDIPDGPPQSCLAFARPIGEVLLLRGSSGDWHLDGRGLEIADPVSTDEFLSKVGFIASRRQEAI
jgi:hypothetical protein